MRLYKYLVRNGALKSLGQNDQEDGRSRESIDDIYREIEEYERSLLRRKTR